MTNYVDVASWQGYSERKSADNARVEFLKFF